MRSLLSFLLVVGLVALLFIYLEQNGITVTGLGAIDQMSMGLAIMLAAVLGVLMLGLLRERFTRALKSVAIWIVVVLALAVGYTFRFEVRDIADRVMAEFVPGHAASRGHIAEIARGHNGNFVVTTQVNGARLSMILDTGASSVVLTQDAAKAAGLPLEVLTYSVTVDTANGRTRAAPVTLQSITIGGLMERDVTALVAQRGQLRQSLLGMSFLNRLQSWEVRGDRLVLRAYP